MSEDTVSLGRRYVILVLSSCGSRRSHRNSNSVCFNGSVVVCVFRYKSHDWARLGNSERASSTTHDYFVQNWTVLVARLESRGSTNRKRFHPSERNSPKSGLSLKSRCCSYNNYDHARCLNRSRCQKTTATKPLTNFTVVS